LIAAGAAVALAVGTVGCGGRSDNNSSGNGGTGGTASVKPGVGFDGTTITLGVLADQSGPAAPLGTPIVAGLDTYFKAVNAKGGVKGKYKVKLEIADTKYNPTTAITQYNQTKSKVVMFAHILGTPIVDAMKQQLTGDGLLAQPSTQDAFWVKEPNLLPIGTPYQIQAINGLQYAVDKLDAKTKKVCALTKDDPYGQAGKQGYDYAVQKLSLNGTVATTYKQSDTDYTAPISQLKNAGCEIVHITGLPSEVGKIMGGAAQAQFAPMWLGASATWLNVLAASQVAPYMQKYFLFAAEGPNWGDTTVPGMADQMKAIDEFAKETKPDGYFTFGFNEGRAVHQVLDAAVDAGDLSPKGVLDASHKIPSLTFGGVYGDYKYGSPADREPPRANTIFKIDPSKPNGTDAVTKVESEAAKSFTFKS
jgi:ABC-type branched-subunit amino acid transport system substrate-binding protein